MVSNVTSSIPESDKSSPSFLAPSASMENADLPTVLILRRPPVFVHLESEFCRNFNFITAFDSPLPLTQFLSSSPAAADATAMLVSSVGPPITPDILRHLPSLRCIVTTSVGFNHIDLAECRRRGISVANAGEIFSEDTVVALLIDISRKISAGDRYVRNGSWKVEGDLSLGSKLGGKRVGIVGLGKIGSRIAKRLNAFGCKILYTSRKQKSSLPYTFYSDIYSLANDSDILVLSCALTEETKHIVNKEVLSALGKGGILINIARGAVVDEEELVRSLVEGRIAGAGLDVFEHEPLVPKELLEMDNVVLTPHLAVNTTESYRSIFECVTGNLKAFFSGQPLLTQVSL